MGTTYSIKISGSGLNDEGEQRLQSEIDALLAGVNQVMSTYIEDSELSRLNKNRTGDPLPVSSELYGILEISQEIYELTDGAFDVTVQPLVALWGFGNKGPRWEPPLRSEISDILLRTGSRYMYLLDGKVIKLVPQIEIDLSAIAKGYGVDQVSKLLADAGYANHMVEIGGEIVCSGEKADGEAWRIGIQYPDVNTASGMKLIGTVKLNDLAMATSGNYRIYFDFEGQRYSHTIDPKTGFPVDNATVSATIVSENCTLADALATAVMVLGKDKGLELVESQPNTECFIVTVDSGNSYQKWMSSGFGKLLDAD